MKKYIYIFFLCFCSFFSLCSHNYNYDVAVAGVIKFDDTAVSLHALATTFIDVFKSDLAIKALPTLPLDVFNVPSSFRSILQAKAGMARVVLLVDMITLGATADPYKKIIDAGTIKIA